MRDNACAAHEVFEVLPLSFPAAWVNVGKLPTTLCWKIPWPPPVSWVNLHVGGRYITSLLEGCQLVFTIFFGGVCSLAEIHWLYMVLEYLANLHVIHGKIRMHLVQVCVRFYAVMPSAKGLVAETHPHFIGIYGGVVSTAFCIEIVESEDAYLFAGSIFKDYSSVDYSFLLKQAKAIIVQPERVGVGNGPAFGCLMMEY